MRDDDYDDEDDRRPSRSRRRDDDDDDRDEPARRRRRREDSDDDWEPKSGGGSSRSIVAIVAVAVLVGICVIVSVVAVVAYSRQGKEDEEHARATRPQQPSNSGLRFATIDDVKKISDAMQRYHDDKNEFPPPSMKTRDGKPGLSWRVAILPYLNHDDLYRQFKLDEAWDHPDNKRLAAKMPEVFGRGGGAFAQMTSVKVFVGAGAIFDPDHPEMRKKSALKDGPAKALLFAVSMPHVNWIAPEDIPFDQNADRLMLIAGIQDSVSVALADGTVGSIKRSMDPERLKLWVMPNTGKDKGSLGE